jgi:Helix-turn-helix domain
LLEFIKSGKLTIDKIVTPEKLKMISETICNTGLEKSAELKAVLGANYSYNEIKAVLYHLEHEKTKE